MIRKEKMKRSRREEEKSHLESYEFVYGRFFEVSQLSLNTFFPACLYI